MSNSRLLEMFKESATSSIYARKYLEYLTMRLLELDCNAIGQFIDLMQYAREKGSTVYFIGNGGSASTATHCANDLAIGTRSWHKPLKAISLCDNNAILTAIANDYSYDEIFSRQLQVLAKSGDVVVAISVSGNSPSIIQAVDYANSVDCITVGMTGFDGGKLKQQCKLNLHAPTNRPEYGPAEDIHLVLNHLVASYLMLAVADETSNLAESKLAS